MDDNNVENVELAEYRLQSDRIRKILDQTIHKLKLMACLPSLLDNDGEILRDYLTKTEVDFIMLVAEEKSSSRSLTENRSDLLMLSNMLDRINMFERKSSMSVRKKRSYMYQENFEAHVSFVVDTIFKCRPLLQYMETLTQDPNPLIANFIDSMEKLRQIADMKLSLTAAEEMKRESDLKTAYRSSMILSINIDELEEVLEKQREELDNEYDKKQKLLEELNGKLKSVKDKCKQEISQTVYDSETRMMKDYNKSIELQQELTTEGEESGARYEMLLQDHLAEEKTLRSKRYKVEAQLASWLAKYDQDIGDKQAEYEDLENTLHTEQDEYEKLENLFYEQEEEYTVLMKEKEDEENRINEEKAWVFLQNRSARRIQRCWRDYRVRKLARKKKKKKKKELKECIAEEESELGKELARKKSVAEDLSGKINTLEKEAQRSIHQIVFESETTFIKNQNVSFQHQEQLSSEARSVTHQYQNFLQNHLNQEKMIRKHRLEVESQLAALIDKYDTDIGKKVAEYEELEAFYNGEVAKFVDLQAQFNAQEKEYLVLMKEKEDEERRIAEEKAKKFLMNLAALRIQRYWRAYRVRKLAKKKKKGKKSKAKKEETEASVVV